MHQNTHQSDILSSRKDYFNVKLLVITAKRTSEISYTSEIIKRCLIFSTPVIRIAFIWEKKDNYSLYGFVKSPYVCLQILLIILVLNCNVNINNSDEERQTERRR